MGVLLSRSTKLRIDQFIAAAEAVARQVTPEDLAAGAMYPPVATLREVSANVAKAVAQKAYDGGFATALPKPHNLLEMARQRVYCPHYRRYR